MSFVEERLSKILTGQLRVRENLIDTEATLENLSFDSLVLVELGLILEKEFGIQLIEGELTEQLTIGDLTGLLESKGAA